MFDPVTGQALVTYLSGDTSTRMFLSPDERGSIMANTNNAGSLSYGNPYDEYGQPMPWNQFRYQYTGQAWLSEVKLYDYKARMYSPALGRFMQTDPTGYSPSPNLYAYVLNDPINLLDPLGLDVGRGGTLPLSYCYGGCDPIVITGNYTKVQFLASSYGARLDWRETFGGGGGGTPSTPAPKPNPTPEKKKFTCADALNETGQIRATGFNVTAVLGLGWTVTRGTWFNMSTGTTGRFTTYGFAAGLEAGAGATIVTYANIRAFTGWSDSYSVGASLPLGPVAIGGAYQHSSNDSGSGSGGFGGVGPAAGFRPPGASGSFTETTISQCKPGG